MLLRGCVKYTCFDIYTSREILYELKIYSRGNYNNSLKYALNNIKQNIIWEKKCKIKKWAILKAYTYSRINAEKYKENIFFPIDLAYNKRYILNMCV